MSNEYTGKDIDVVGILDHIRLRPGMYIDSPDDPSHLLVEAIDNAIDEAINGYSNKTIVKYNTKTHEVEVTDFGRGIPIDDKELFDHNGKPTGKAPALEILFTIANSGGKFTAGKNFKISGGLHGLGNKIINSLSKHVWVQSRRDGKKMTYESKDGGKKVGLTTEKLKRGEKRGTTLRFTPDEEVFDTPIIPKEFIISKCHIANSFGYPVEFYLNDELINLGSGKLEELLPDEHSGSSYFKTEFSRELSDGQSVRVLIDYTSDTKNEASSFTNMVMNSRGGTHVYEFNDAIRNAWKPYIGDRFIKPDDTLLGVKSVVSVYITKPAFGSQTKDKLTIKKRTDQYRDIVKLFDGVSLDFSKFLKKHEEYRKALLDRFEEYRKSISKLQSQKEIDDLVQTNEDTAKTGRVRRRSVVSKLRECSSTSRKDTELFICEGDSAAGSLIKTRDPKMQAVFPIRGKILNVSKVNNILKNIKNQEVLGIVNAAGTGVGENCDPEKSRYERYFISCFTGDMRVKLLNGSTPTFEELVSMEKDNPDQEYWTYSSLPDGTVVPGLGRNPRITDYVDTLVTVELDDGTVINCTPDHKFMSRDGVYIEAQDLLEGQSLMPNYTKIKEDRGKSYNHKVRKVEWHHYDEKVPVYCLTVDTYHNFTVMGNKGEGGVVVSNCDADPD